MGGKSKCPLKNTSVRKQSDVGFMQADNNRIRDYRLQPGGSFKRAGTDGRDVGADVDAIEKVTRNADSFTV